MVRIRDGEILERKVIGKNEDGEPITADVVASIRDQIVCNDKILNRTVGLPRTEGDSPNAIDPARIFIDTLEGLINYLARTDQGALEVLELHIRNFSHDAAKGGLRRRTAIDAPGYQGVVIDDEVR